MNSTARFAPHPSIITLHQQSRVLEIAFADGHRFELPCEFLRVYSPSADVRGHGPGQEVLQRGKKEVLIERIEPVGNYAIRLIFSDGHGSGIYTWSLLYDYGMRYESMWREYLERLRTAGGRREPTHEFKSNA